MTINMEAKHEMVEIAQDANDLSKTVSEVDVPMSSEIEQKPIGVKNEEEKAEISLTRIESNTTAASSAELIFHIIRKNNKKVTFQEPIRTDKV
jgi:copper chaperone CopZ